MKEQNIDSQETVSTSAQDPDPGLQARDQMVEGATGESGAAAGPVPPPVSQGDGSFDPTWTTTSMPDGNAPDMEQIESLGHAEYGAELDRAAAPAPMPKSMVKPRKGTKEPG